LHGLHFDMMETLSFVGRVTIVPEKSVALRRHPMQAV
jgi:hypothetical protein